MITYQVMLEGPENKIKEQNVQVNKTYQIMPEVPENKIKVQKFLLVPKHCHITLKY